MGTTMSSRAVGAGVFVLLGVALFTVALFMIGERRMLFEDRFELFTELETLGQLQQGAVVRVAGMDAGEVTEVEIPASPDRPFRVRMEIREDLRQLVRTDSVASMQTEGLLGGMYVNIATGSMAAPEVAEGGTIEGREPFTMADLLQQASDTIAQVNETVETLSADLETTIGEIETTATEARALVTDIAPEIRAIADNGARISADTQNIVAGLQNGEGTIGRLLKDDTLYERAREIAEEARVVMANVRDVTDEARRAIADFRSEDGPAQGVLSDVRLTLSQSREAMADLADNMEALKHNFLLRGFFNRRGYYDLDAISPAQYQEGVLENGRRRAMRIWLGSDVLFEEGPNGVERLSEGGRTRVDSAITTYLRYLPANPLVVEGFADAGSVADRYRLSRQRAGIVREYLLGRYGLTPQNIGYIALGDEAPGSPDGDTWDGVAVTLFLDTNELQFASQPR